MPRLGWLAPAALGGLCGAACIPAPVVRARDASPEVEVAVSTDLGVRDVLAADAVADDAADAAAPDAVDAADVVAADVVAADAGGCVGGVMDGGACVVSVPRLLRPMSGAISGSRRPELRWVPGSGGGAETLRLCADRACTRVLHRAEVAAGVGIARVTEDLPVGPVFWRVESAGDAGVPRASATWEFFVSGRAANSVFWYGVPDFDGDGTADLVIGAFRDNTGRGAVYGYPSTLTAMTPPNWTLRGTGVENGWFGFVVANLGDVNGDGFEDLGVSAPNEYNRFGAVRIYHGSASGIRSIATTTLVGDNEAASFGVPIAGIGDVDGDGFGDIAVGSPGASSDQGLVTIFLGSSIGLDRERRLVVTRQEGPVSYFAGAIEALGDIDSDGLDDFIVGAPGASSGAGAAWVFRGGGASTLDSRGVRIPPLGVQYFGGTLTTLGDLDGNGRVDFAIGAPTDGGAQGRVYVFSGNGAVVPTSPTTTIVPIEAHATSFGQAISGGHDLDGDEHPDLAVGVASFNNWSGALAIYRGGGFQITSPDRVLDGTNPRGSEFGNQVSILGDLDRDGRSELVVSAPHNQTGVGGIVYLFRGSAVGVVTTEPTTITNPGTSAAEFGIGLTR